MTGNALTGLMMMGARAPDAAGSPKPSQKADRSQDDSFSGIFNEKMREVSNSSREANRASSRKPLESAAKPDAAKDEKQVGGEEPKAEKTGNTSKTEANGAAASQEKPARSATDKTESGKTDDGKKDRKSDSSDADDATGTLSLVASLLESIFGKLDELVAAKTGGQQIEGASEAGSAGNSNPLETLKTLLDGQTGKLKELLDKLQAKPEAGDSQVKALLEELQNVLSKIQQIGDSAGAGANGKITVKLEKEGGDPAALLAQLQTQGREIMDKLKVKLGDAAKQVDNDSAGQSELAPLQSEEAPKAEADTKAEAASTKNEDPKTEARIKPEAEAVSAKAGNKAETAVNRQPQAAVNPDVQAQPQKPETNAAVKPEKADFYLSEKPLSQSVSNQVTMKIRLMAGENRQEMEVNLKPDTLGKLNLKIVHEHGEVLAKITAESEQVKSILESNMQLLKDSLEKSGFSVQSLNVSVGNGNSGNQTQDQGSRKDRAAGQKTAVNEVSGVNRAARPTVGWNPAEDASSIDLSA